MNKSELIDYICENSSADLSKAAAGELLDVISQAIRGELQKGGECSLQGLGKFKVSRREKSQGRNPRTGEAITIAARNVVKFTVGKELKDAVNK